MAYLGSTQASTLANPPQLIVTELGAGPDVHIAGSTSIFTGNNYLQNSTAAAWRGGLGAGNGLWMYTTTDMTSAPFDGSYFTDGGPLGMRPGDVVIIKSHGTTVMTSWYLRLACVGYVTTGGTAILSTQSLITCST